MKMLLQGCLEGIDIDVVEMTYAELSTEETDAMSFVNMIYSLS